jgi:hypothetical protein
MSNVADAVHTTTPPRPQRPRPQYSLYDNIRCTGAGSPGDGEPPQCDLPMEVVCNIFDFANFTCAMSAAASSIVHRYAIDATLATTPRHRRDARKRRCEKKLCPWTIKEGWKHTYLCSRACFKETCIFQ